MRNENLTGILHEIYLRAKTIFGERLTDVILYGSYARGDQDEGSDIDIMILADINQETIRAYREALCDMAWELGMEYDIVVSVLASGNGYFHEWKSALPFYQNVWNEGRRIVA